MLNSLLTRIFGSRNERLLRQFHKNVAMFGGLLFAMVDSTNYRRAPAPKTQLAS